MNGHPPRDVWDYTPRQIAGYMQLAQARTKQEYASRLSLNATAAQGTEKSIKKIIKELERE